MSDLLAPLIEARRAMVADMLAEFRAAAAQSRKERLTAMTHEMRKVTLRDGPFGGMAPDPKAAWGPIPGTTIKAFPNPPRSET